MDVFSKSDPMCVVFTHRLGTNEYVEYFRTEEIKDTLNPDFVRKVIIDYYFEETQKLKFELYDIDSPSKDLRNHDFLGAAQCTLGEIMSAGGQHVMKLSGPKKDCGKIKIRGEEMSECRDVLTLQFKCENLDKMDFFGKSDPFLVFSRSNEDSSFTICHKTEVIKKTLNPTFRPFTILLRALCNADYDRNIKVDCYDWNSNGTHDYIGSFQTTARELTRGPGHSNTYPIVNEDKKRKKKSYKNSGLAMLTHVKVDQQFSFLDYIRGGCQIAATVAVDFTASNGDPRQPTSLHYMNPYQPNHYQRAIHSVVEVLQDYDADKLFPALGFGARIPPDHRVSHEFFLNGNPSNPFCEGVEGIEQAYQQALHSVTLYGPTNFAPVINHITRFAAAKRDGSEYFILLIITDGIITDMEQTKEAIVSASVLPLSIIIVGVGKEDFAKMEELDGDDVRLSSRGRFAQRDIVQFVPFRDFEGTDNIVLSQARLAKEVLAEIPDQFLSYMKANNIRPKPVRTASMMSSASAPPM
ncbi:copine-8-like isoform X3 [Amphiura filiformis]